MLFAATAGDHSRWRKSHPRWAGFDELIGGQDRVMHIAVAGMCVCVQGVYVGGGGGCGAIAGRVILQDVGGGGCPQDEIVC